MLKKPFTGGELNKLNGAMGVSAPYNSVPLTRLMKFHDPQTPEELEELIANHQEPGCPCGIVSKGTVQDFGRNLYNSQQEYWGEYKFTLEECVQWEYDLFIGHTFTGVRMEKLAYFMIQDKLGDPYRVEFANQKVDEDFRVDLEVYFHGVVIAGVQVKPESYKKSRRSVQEYNKIANKRYGKPVFYVYYDYGAGNLLNLDSVLVDIIKVGNKIVLKGGL